MKLKLLFVFLFPLFLFGQEIIYLENSVQLLHKLKVTKTVIDSIDETFIEHTPNRMRISAFSHYYDEVYGEMTDSLGIYEEVVDTTYIPIKEVTDYYYNSNDLLDSLFDYTILLDSNTADTFLVQTFFYAPNGQLEKSIQKKDAWGGNTQIVEERYFWSGKRIDSIWTYSNFYESTFGPTYVDSLHFDAKFNFVYNPAGQKIQKQHYIKVVETYSYPEINVIETLKATTHPRSGCIENSDVSRSKRELISYYPNGLVKQYKSFYRTKNNGEEWQEEVGFVWRLEYEFGE